MFTRHIVQIVTNGHKETGRTQSEESLFALCNDGTVWCINNRDSRWRLLPRIPQESRDYHIRTNNIW